MNNFFLGFKHKNERIPINIKEKPKSNIFNTIKHQKILSLMLLFNAIQWANNISQYANYNSV